MNASDFDVVVIGAGPSGSATALALAARGLRVGVAERSAFPRDKVCGCTLDPRAVAALERLGLASTLAALRPVALRHVRIAARSRGATLPLRGTLAVSRTAFDAALASAAASAGAHVATGHAVLGITREGGGFVVARAGAKAWTARAVVTAAGLADASLSQPSVVDAQARIGVAATLDANSAAFARDELRMWVGADGYLGVARLEDDRVRVAAALAPAAVRGDIGAALDRVLADAGSPWRLPRGVTFRATPPLTRTRGAVAEPGLFAVGDACGYVEPFSGEGIGWALLSAELVTPAVVAALAGDARAHRDYDANWRSRVGAHRRAAERLLAWSRHPRWFAAALTAIRIAPPLARVWMPT
ncbi:MAG: FAD-dependent monooxygenase [Planctomycetes bacterium]|nr:FAD-dependent monooxygenase [Planctomycetota bacterium]MCC7170490.1 FAD-dependent monooxygenase [Planctomycetota bacterium]